MKISNEYIVDLLRLANKLFYNFLNNALEVASTYVTSDKEYNAVLMAATRAIDNAGISISASLLVMFFVMGIMKSATNFQELRKPEFMVSALLRLILASWLVSNAYEITKDIYRICQGFGDRLIYDFGWSSGVSYRIPYVDPDMEDAIMDLSFSEGLPVFALALVASVIMVVLGMVIVFVTMGRAWRLVIIMCFSPIAFSSLAGEPSQGICRSWLKTFVACGLEIIVIFMAFRLYLVCAAGGNTFFIGKGLTSNSAVGRTLLWLVQVTMYQLLLCGTIKGADRVTQQIIG